MLWISLCGKGRATDIIIPPNVFVYFPISADNLFLSKFLIRSQVIEGDDNSLLSLLIFLLRELEDRISLPLFFFISQVFDVFDGYLARRYNMSSKFGDYFDHIADAIKTILLFYILFIKYDLGHSKILIVILYWWYRILTGPKARYIF